jgi:hypothetical protein
MDINTILSQIDLGSFALPEFQRGYVWNRDQVRKLMHSLYKGYPIGGLLVWDTVTNPDISRGDGPLSSGHVKLILDGQQRITTLYGIIKGKPPMFFDGNAAAFTNLYFNIEEEAFEFYAATKMQCNPIWVNVTSVMKLGASIYAQQAVQRGEGTMEYWFGALSKLTPLENIKNQELHVQEVSGENMTIDVVVEIFNNVNSGGTKLSKGDLALAKICAEWPEARMAMKAILEKYKNAGYDFNLDWFLRCVTVYLTNQPYFAALSKCSISDFKKGLFEANSLIGTCLDHIGTRLGLDHARVLGGVYAIATMVGYLHMRGKKLSGSTEWDKLLFWYIHTFLWGRYTGSTESILAQDLNVLEKGEGIDGLIKLLRQNRGDLTIRAEDFWGWSTGARFYPLLYLLTRTGHSKDWGSGLELSNALLGKNSTLEIHHIFPKDLLYKAGKSKSIVNALANYAFLTKDTNITISNRPPEDYIPEYKEIRPGALESHWIPNNPELWKIDNYERFLEERRALLATSANGLLDSLYAGRIAETAVQSYADRENMKTHVDEEEAITNISSWLTEHHLTEGIPNFELLDHDGKVTAIIDLAWPNGLQSGLSEPIALLINDTPETLAIVSQSGYRYYTDIELLKSYIITNYLE